MADQGNRERRVHHNGAPSRHGSAPQASRWHMDIFHRPSLRRRFLVGRPRAAANGIAIALSGKARLAVAELSQKNRRAVPRLFGERGVSPATRRGPHLAGPETSSEAENLHEADRRHLPKLSGGLSPDSARFQGGPPGRISL